MFLIGAACYFHGFHRVCLFAVAFSLGVKGLGRTEAPKKEEKGPQRLQRTDNINARAALSIILCHNSFGEHRRLLRDCCARMPQSGDIRSQSLDNTPS